MSEPPQDITYIPEIKPATKLTHKSILIDDGDLLHYLLWSMGVFFMLGLLYLIYWRIFIKINFKRYFSRKEKRDRIKYL